MIDLSKITVPEEKLLVSLCRLRFTDEQITRLNEFMQQVTDWNHFTRLANEHGIIALVAYNIKEAGLENKMPGYAMAILKNGYMQSLVRNTWLTERWKEVNTILDNAGIKHIVLKGMALEHTIYGAKGLRQMNDNDIFIKSVDALKAWQLLQQEGFTSDPVKSPLFRKIVFDLGEHLPALYKNGYAVEIHDNLSDITVTGENNTTDPFSDAAEIFIGKTKALMLQRERHLAFLVRHFEKHAMAGNCQLRLYTDIILLDEKNPITVPAYFISDPKQEHCFRYRKASYKATLRFIPAKHRLLFITGDIFPSLKWMKKRYACSGLKALLYYPARIGKVVWLV